MKDYKRIEHMRNLNDSLIWERMKRCYDYGYEDGKADTPFTDTEEAEKKAYNRGLNEAWEAARTISTIPFTEQILVFNESGTSNVLGCNTASEALAKIKAYEDKQDAEIKVGDEVWYTDRNQPRVVTCIYEDALDDMSAVQITPNGKWLVNQVKNLHKTGRHFPQIAEVLKEMRGAENDE